MLEMVQQSELEHQSAPRAAVSIMLFLQAFLHLATGDLCYPDQLTASLCRKSEKGAKSLYESRCESALVYIIKAFESSASKMSKVF